MNLLDDVDAVAFDIGSVLLRPRPFAKAAGSLILLPLLQQRPSTKSLPIEIWERILRYVFAEYDGQALDANLKTRRRSLLLVCKTLKVRRVRYSRL